MLLFLFVNKKIIKFIKRLQIKDSFESHFGDSSDMWWITSKNLAAACWLPSCPDWYNNTPLARGLRGKNTAKFLQDTIDPHYLTPIKSQYFVSMSSSQSRLMTERMHSGIFWQSDVCRCLTTYWVMIQYIPRNMHTVFALLCFVVVIHWLIFPYPSGLLHWHCGNLTIAPVPAKQPWWIWINTSCEFIMKDCITTT